MAISKNIYMALYFIGHSIFLITLLEYLRLLHTQGNDTISDTYLTF